MSKKIIAIVPAAGVGERAKEPKICSGLSVAQSAGQVTQSALPVNELPKQYRLLKGQPMLRLAVQALLADPRVEQVRVAVAKHDSWVESCLQGLPRTVWRPCGGPSRAATVMAALQDAQLDPDDWVLVHDAARPGLPLSALARLIDTCLLHDAGGLLAQPVADTVKQAAPARSIGPEPCALTGGAQAKMMDAVTVRATLSRESLWLAQTPQMFKVGVLLNALLTVQTSLATITDEASAVELAGFKPYLVQGSVRNFKVTWPDDFDLMEKWL